MTYLTNNKNIIEEQVKINDIPCIILKPRNENRKLPTIIFYHGWSSNKEMQKFRGFILASLGYQVIIPDSIYHGERNPIDYNNIDNIGKYFWKTILSNIQESKDIINTSIDIYDVDLDNIVVMGHSMGGFTTAGIFTHDKRIKTSIIINGSFNWGMSNEIFSEQIGKDIILDQEDEIMRLDPMNNLDELVDRPILLLNGGSDKVVSINPQKIFYNTIKDSYKDGSKIKFIKYTNIGHFVTTSMMEDTAKWLDVNID